VHTFPWPTVAAVGLLATACGGAFSPAGAVDAPLGTARDLLGNPAPDFSVPLALGGRGEVSLRALRGRVVVLDFWGTFCAPCKAAFPKLESLNTKYAESGLQVVAISEDDADDQEKIAGFAAAHGARFAIAWDRDRTIARDYKPDAMPSTFVIDRRGVVRYEHVGYRDGDERQIEREVQELLLR
jgi:peroxiredoxin